MSREKLVRVTDTLDGLEYFEKMLPECYHAVSGYSGVSFANTLRMLHYDLKGGQILLAPEHHAVDRMIAINDRGQVTGVGVSNFLPQFASALDYEQYLIVAADTADTFFRLLQELRKKTPKYELITFRSQEREFLCDAGMMGCCNSIHNWSLYMVSAGDNDVPTSKIVTAPLLPESNVSIEAMPERYCAFAGAGLTEYSVWLLEDEYGKPIAVASLLPYCSKNKEIKLWYRQDSENYAHMIATFLRKALYIEMGSEGSAIWRIKTPNTVERAVLGAGQFHCVGQEAHYHFGCDSDDCVI